LSLGDRPHGLLLVVGPTGSGKSTTLACLVNRINQSRSCRIITVEDPIEYTHESAMATIDQREVHADTQSFSAALKYVLRQDPDVILIGEMRDLETIQAAITAAETGHLVLATLHTNDAIQAIDRVIDVFPPYQQPQVRAQLAAALLGVVSQRLIPRADNQGRVAAFEVLIANPAIRTLVRDGKMHQAASVMETNLADGMITLDRSLVQLYRNNLITRDEAMRYVLNPKSLLETRTFTG
jgi:twitching motility protein PilT